MAMSVEKEKDERWAKQFGDFAENLTMYVVGQLQNMSVALIDHVGADIIASKRDNDVNPERYAISVKGRNLPDNESKSYNFSWKDIENLKDTAEMFGVIPAVSFVFVDDVEGKKKIRMFIAKMDDLEKMARNQEIDFLNFTLNGLNFNYLGRNKRHLTNIRNNYKKEIAYFELQFNELEGVEAFQN
jgi:hypothetical protein